MDDLRLYSPNYVKQIINDYDFKFSKSLGQNFLIDGNIVRNIVKSAGVTKEDGVIEVGPGIGTLTEEISLQAKKVVSVEIDKTLLPILDETLGKYDNIKIVNDDILNIDLNKLIEEEFDNKKVKVVANLPYYVTTPIITKLIEKDYNIDSITVMVQKEIAERMVAKPNSKQYGSLSVFVQYYTDPEIMFEVPNSVFIPKPKVGSAIIKLKLKEELADTNRDKLFNIVRGSFATRRKTILNSLSNYGFEGVEKEEIKNALIKADIDPISRAEQLNIEDYLRLEKVFPEK